MKDILGKNEKEVLGRFIEFGWFDWSDIGYFDRYDLSLAANSKMLGRVIIHA